MKLEGGDSHCVVWGETPSGDRDGQLKGCVTTGPSVLEIPRVWEVGGDRGTILIPKELPFYSSFSFTGFWFFSRRLYRKSAPSFSTEWFFHWFHQQVLEQRQELFSESSSWRSILFPFLNGSNQRRLATDVTPSVVPAQLLLCFVYTVFLCVWTSRILTKKKTKPCMAIKVQIR